MTEANTVSLQVHSVSSTFKEPEWLLRLREDAWRQFAEFPEPRLEKTNLAKRGWETGAFVSQTAAIPDSVRTYLSGLNHPYALFVDGHVVEVKITEELTRQGIVFTDIHSAAASNGELVKQHLASVVKPSDNKWSALSMALFAGGAFLYVPRNVQSDVPFEVVHAFTSTASGTYPRNLVVADELSDVRLIEVTFAPQEKERVTSSHVTEVIAKSNSRVHVAAADEFPKGSTQFVTRRAQVGKDAVVEWTVSDVSNGFTVELVEDVLEGNGARGQTRVIGLGYGRQHMDLTASMVHKGRNTESDITMHGALRERANTVFRSCTEIVKGAVGAGSEQHDRMIMIDGTARADAIPMLLIDENDVNRCGHAASVGKIDPNQIYYLMSRGIPQAQATQMIIWGYLRDSVEALPSAPLRDLVVARLERELSR
ncbi:SufB/SufD family protein [Alicyclobacillus fastidiosus]|uniref:SufD family Fe-S cluster assembly protein n=1 Tax=Alicyclobacillus fastidiosus TaxID=392011 RepID=A0ABV5ADM6_9BACL|nr:SufD family Fe-S cluster assembly protein [Alicyclobacillus fastidiosus]WEH08619.1 SufD family Fe-S cluster assembly protein [Alicyclobacillus fastidiosus]